MSHCRTTGLSDKWAVEQRGLVFVANDYGLVLETSDSSLVQLNRDDCVINGLMKAMNSDNVDMLTC